MTNLTKARIINIIFFFFTKLIFYVKKTTLFYIFQNVYPLNNDKYNYFLIYKT